jgi:hypothetical protein
LISMSFWNKKQKIFKTRSKFKIINFPLSSFLVQKDSTIKSFFRDFLINWIFLLNFLTVYQVDLQILKLV